MSHDSGEVQAARRRVLDPHLSRLREWNQRIPGTARNRAATVLIGKRLLRVEAGERAVIENWAPGRQAPHAESQLVMDSLALMVKLLAELEQTGDSPAAQSRLDAEIVLSVALGEAILKQLKRLAGNTGENPRSTLESRMAHCLEQARLRLDDAGADRVRALSAGFELHPPPRKPSPSATRIETPRSNFSLSLADELDREQATTAELLLDREDGEDLELPEELQALAEPPSRLSRRTRAALLFCACSIAFWALATRMPGLLRGESAGVDPSPLEAFDWVDRVTVRPASLYIDVHRDRWRALTHGERWEAMKQLADHGSRSGARGMLVRGEDGLALAQWIDGRGIVLHDEPAVDLMRLTGTKSEGQ